MNFSFVGMTSSCADLEGRGEWCLEPPLENSNLKVVFKKNYRKIGLEYYQTYAYYLFLNEIRNVMTKINRNVQHYLLNLCM